MRQNDEGIIYGLTYIDHNTKCVFNGSDIGKDYSAKAILEKCEITQILHSPKSVIQDTHVASTIDQAIDQDRLKENISTQLIDDIISPSEELQWLPYEFKKRRKKKRKPNH